MHTCRGGEISNSALAPVLTVQFWDAYSFSLRYSVVLPMPSRRAAIILSPLTWASALKMVCFSSSAMGTMPVLGWLIPIKSIGAL